MKTLDSNSIYNRNFYCINDKKEKRWLIEDDKKAIKILKQWQPYRFISKILWKIIITSLKYGFLKLLPFCKLERLVLPNEIIPNNIEINELVFVIFFGRKNIIEQKAIIFLIDKKNNICKYAIKKAISGNAWNSIKYEYSVLKELEKEKYHFAPNIYKIDESNQSILQEYIEGKTSGLVLNNYHYQLLAALSNRNSFIDMKKYYFKIKKFYEIQKINKIRKFPCKEVEEVLNFDIWDKKILSVRAHGDFAPWNIKYDKNQKILKAYDWEKSINLFFPFYDLIFFKNSVKHHLKKTININIENYLTELEKQNFHIQDDFLNPLYKIAKILVFIEFKKRKL